MIQWLFVMTLARIKNHQPKPSVVDRDCARVLKLTIRDARLNGDVIRQDGAIQITHR